MDYKYIFVVGAPGSKWSGVSKNFYYSPDLDNTDYSENRLYAHDASGQTEPMHSGSYFDPGMEFGNFFDELDQYTKEECEAEFDRAFTGDGIRTIRSHVFAHHLDFIRRTWPECPIVLVHRSDDECLGWWVKCGHFNITYPLYHTYYKDLRTMSKIIENQNADILTAINTYGGMRPDDNLELCEIMGIQPPPEQYRQNYSKINVKVVVI